MVVFTKGFDKNGTGKEEAKIRQAKEATTVVMKAPGSPVLKKSCRG